MAWRIHHHVQRGEIDNRQRGRVRGQIWLHGVPEPLVLELEGNACPDLAGCLLTFQNPGTTYPLSPGAALAPVQRGTIGDLTASRKVRVPDVPVEEFLRLRKAGQPAPEHMANCLYLEWFSEANGRVVVESTEYQLTISPPAWTLTAKEETQRQRDAAQGFAGFMQKLSAAVEAVRHEPPEDKEWDEFDYEKFMRECDARTDKYAELLDKYMDHPDRERLIAREMGWTWLEEALDEAEPGHQPNAARAPASDEKPEPEFAEPDEDDLDIEEINRICAEAAAEPLVPDPATEGVDWVRDQQGYVKHPLALRAFEGSVALMKKYRELGLENSEDADVIGLMSEFRITGAKLAGALNSLAYDRHLREGAFIVAYLKRALGHLHAAQAALTKVTPKKLVPDDVLQFARTELFEIREEILRLMQEFRDQK